MKNLLDLLLGNWRNGTTEKSFLGSIPTYDLRNSDRMLHPLLNGWDASIHFPIVRILPRQKTSRVSFCFSSS